MSVAATRICCEAFMPIPKISMPTTRATILYAIIAIPAVIVPAMASASPNRMPGLRPYLSVILPTAYETRKRLIPNRPTVRPARLAEPVSAMTISGPIP